MAKCPRWVLWVFGLLLAYALLGFLILPPIVRLVAVKQLARQLDRSVSIEKLRLNPFALSATIRGLLVKDKDGEPFISWDELYVNFQLSSLLGRPWVFREISLKKPFVRVQMDRNYQFNFSDLIAKFSTNAAPAPPTPPRPVALRIGRLHLEGASASLTDLTPRTPFRRVLGPLDVTLVNFRTDPDNKNPYSFAGTTDAGEKFAWSGFFYLDPIRSQGEFSLENLALNKYAPLYQDFVRFQIKDGVAGIRSAYHLELSLTNRVASVTNMSFHLRSLVIGGPANDTNIVELPDFSVTGASLDAVARHAEVGSLAATDARLWLQRNRADAINVVELARPPADATNAPGGIVFLLRFVTNAVALLLNSTNQWTGIVHAVALTNCAVSLRDEMPSRPATLDLDHIMFSARNISNLPGTNLAAQLALRWNTNGTIRAEAAASLQPPTADVELTLENLDLHSLDPYLEPELNLYILGSKLGLKGRLQLRTPADGLPRVTFKGDARLDDFSTVDGVFGQDLLKWNSVRVQNLEANLNPPTIAIQQIAVDDAYARLIIETNHTINLLTALRRESPSAPGAASSAKPAGRQKGKLPTAAPEAPASAPAAVAGVRPKISVGSIVISNAQARFTDRSLTPNVNAAVEQVNGTIAGLSSDELRHAEVRLTAQVDGVGPVEITGTVNPLIRNQTTDLKIAARNVDLTPASPYVGKFAGYRLARGKLEADLTYQIADRKIKAENKVTLNQFTFGEKVNSPDATHLPVRLAVAILKDRSGKIVLDVPVEGSLDDPQFRLGKVITRAIVNLITKIATSPFAVLGAAFGGQGEEMSHQDFLPGSFAVQPAAREKLDALAQALYERPGLQVAIEGSVDPVADRDGLRRVKLDQKIRTQKWLSLRTSARASTTADQVTVAPEERAKFLRQLYQTALAKGEITLTNLPAGGGGTAPAAPPKTQMAKGATLLARGYNPLTMSFSAAPAPAAATSGQTPPAGPEAIMEQALLNHIDITESDFETLAADRAKAVRACLLQSGKVAADRLFLAEIQSGRVKAEGSRVYLQLQ